MKRGRPRKQDPKQLLPIIMEVFWEKGFNGTTLSDLVHATGMAKPGLYATFGDKEEIFRKALSYYYYELGVSTWQDLEESDQCVSDSLRSFLLKIAESVTATKKPKGCFLVNSIVEGGECRQMMQELTKTMDQKRRESLQGLFLRALKNKDLPEETNISGLVDFFVGQTTALAVLARAGSSFEDLKAVIELALSALPTRTSRKVS